MAERDFDLVVHGATGFVGKRAVRYLAAHHDIAGLRWAIAGRDRAKLEALAASVEPHPPVLVADGTDAAAVDAMVERTHVVLAMAGPFAIYSDQIVDACVRFGTHYADITGETPWVRSLIDRYHAKASADGTKIVPCCGFDSVPSDMSAYVMARYAQRELGTEVTQVETYYSLAGGLNGGTALTLMLALSDPKALRALRDPVLLNPAGVPSGADAASLRDPLVATYRAGAGGWVAPFIMGPVNTRVVRRSAALYAEWNESYGARFGYQEYMRFPGGPLGAALAGGVAAGTAIGMLAGTTSLGRAVMKPMIPKPGTGPSEKTIADGWFRGRLAAKTADGRTFRGLIAGRGDPNNAITLTCACESALALVHDGTRLPGGVARGGVLTPATAFGDVLVGRLRIAGFSLEAAA